ncbi:MAG: PDZ domain-containing protein [Planctomycetaceae bacterium]|nr:PDZ domain-containing protein [Planctomycetaceae bacterium]
MLTSPPILTRAKNWFLTLGILSVGLFWQVEVVHSNVVSRVEFAAFVQEQEAQQPASAVEREQRGSGGGAGQQEGAAGRREAGSGRQGTGPRRGSGRPRSGQQPAQASATETSSSQPQEPAATGSAEGTTSATQAQAATRSESTSSQESESGQAPEGEGRGPEGRGQGRGRGAGPRVEPAPTTATTIPAAWMDQFKWESIGPANMSGRITALAVSQQDPYKWWAASASGGLLKTVNNGYSFEFQFDREVVVSIGDVQVFPQDDNIVWVGTGEANPRNSVSWGNGVYRSNDGGKTWQHLGLDGTFQIGRIALHPTDSNIAYVGALGRLWGNNEQRGVFKTMDGGKTWEKVLYIDDLTGIIDLKMHPTNPDILVAATYERLRDGFDGNDPVKKFGPGSGLHKTTDGGKTWKKLTQGLPTCNLGRIGLDWSRSNPDHLYAIIESEQIGSGPAETAYLGIRNEAADVGVRVTEVVADGPSAAVLKTGDILLQMDDQLIIKAEDMTKFLARKQAAGEVKLVIVRDGQKVEATVNLVMRPVQVQAQRGSPPRPFAASLGGQRENVQDLQGPEGYQYGGVYRSTDAGETWTRINSVNPRPMYYSQVRVDPVDEKNLYVLGTSLYKSSDGGITFTGDGHGNEVHVDHHAMWIDPKDSRHIILGNDGGVYVTHDRMKTWDHHNHFAIGQFYHIGIDNTPDYKVYGGLQDNGSWGGPRRSRTGATLNSDWFRIGGGDGFVCLVDAEDPDQLYAESQNGAMSRFNLRTGERGSIRPQPPQGVSYRFNWKTPFILSPHNSRIHYSAGNYVFRSYNRGTSIEAISPDITNSNEGSGSAIAESPVRAGVIYAGTTDGAVWVTQNGGQTWEPIYHVPKAAASPETAPANETPTTAAPASPTDPAAASETPPATNPEANTAPRTPRSPRGPRTPGSSRRPTRPVTDPAASEAKSEEAKSEEAKSEEAKAEEAKTEEQKTEDIVKSDPLSGVWEGQFSTSGGEISGEFEMSVTMDNAGVVAGRLNSEEGAMDMIEPQFDREKQTLKFTIETPFGPIQPEFQLKDQEMSAQLPLPNGETLTISAKKRPPVRPLVMTSFLPGTATASQQEPATTPTTSSATPTTSQATPVQESAPTPQPTNTPNQAAAPAAEVPAAEVPAVQQPVTAEPSPATAPAQETPATTTPAQETPPTTTPATTTPAQETPATSTPAQDAPATTTQAQETPATTTPATTTPAQEAPATSTPAQETPATTTPAQDTAAPAAPAQQPGAVAPGSLGSLVPGPRWVSSIEASRYAAGRCYITLDGHRSNDDEIYVFATEDFGKTWKSLKANLPATAGIAWVIREDIVNQNILYLGCEFSTWVSVDRGLSWSKFSSLPTVAVHELAQHPTSGELLAGTHGRSIWVLDVTPLRQLTAEGIAKTANLLKPNQVTRWRSLPERGSNTTREFQARTPSKAAEFYYTLARPAGSAVVVVKDIRGRELFRSEGSTAAGLNKIDWNLRTGPAASGGPRPSGPGGAGGPGAGGPGGGGGPGAGGPGAGGPGGGSGGGRGGAGFAGRGLGIAANGTYLVELIVDGEIATEILTIVGDPNYPSPPSGRGEEEEFVDDEPQAAEADREPLEFSDR